MAPSDDRGGTDGVDGPRDRGIETVRDVVARTLEREGTAILAPSRATDYGAREFATGVWKSANLLAHYGVGPDRPVAVAVGPKSPPAGADPGWLGAAVDPLLAILGGMTLGGPVELATDPRTRVDAPAFVAPTSWLDRFETAPGTAVVAYGGPPEDPRVAHFERERWSENPTEPPEPLAPDRPALRSASGQLSHADLLAAARAVVAAGDLDGASRVEVAVRIDGPGAFVAGVLAPLVAGVPLQPRSGGGSGPDAGEAERGITTVTSEGDIRSVEMPDFD